MSKSNKKVMITVLVLTLVLVIGTTYAWLILTKNSNTVNKITAGNLDLVLDEGNSITLKNEVPRSYKQGMETTEYTFTLTNNSSLSNYKLSLKDLAKYTDEDGKEIVVADENRINDSRIRYILLKDGEVATADKSKILTDRTIDTGTIKKGQTISYTLRVWIDSHAGDNNTESEVMGKIFNVELSLVAEQTSQVTLAANKLCKRATTLHTEECDNDNCRADGYYITGEMKTTTVTYGNLGEKGTLTSGDAFDCDVNGDGVYDSETERFYYVSDMTNGVMQDSNTAVLIYYSSVSNGLPSNSTTYFYDEDGHNNNGPITAVKQLPTTSQWKNVSLTNTKRKITTEKETTETAAGTIIEEFDYSGYAARLLTYQEANNGCYDGTTTVDSFHGVRTKCKYLLENTKYSLKNSPIENEWLETPESRFYFNSWVINIIGRQINTRQVNSDAGPCSVKPVIEVAKTNIEY